MVYGRYNELVFMGYINKHRVWGHHPVWLVVSIPLKNDGVRQLGL